MQYHNSGWNRSTKGRGPWQLVFARQFTKWSEARTFEKQLKAIKNKARLTKRFKEFFIDGTCPACPDEMRR
jgi:predicted GIY-YIG superfamily endonuclease